MRTVLVSIYIDPEFYPPTKNAIFELAKTYEKVFVLTRNLYAQEKNDYPENVELVKSGKFSTVQESEKRSIFSKILSFLGFWFRYQQLSLMNSVEVVLLYDAIPLFAFFISLKKKKIKFWYHNHDMPDIQLTRKFSIGWLSAKYEQSAMKKIDYFSLPSKDRLVYYPNWNRTEDFFYIPNYPRKNLLKSIKSDNRFDRFTIIFQGAIGPGHAIEDVIQLLPNLPEVDFILKGPVRNDYKEKINSLIQTHKVENQVKWVGLTSYTELIRLTMKCHFGIAVHQGRDEVSKTLGTASNKIYEYLASGLPVLLHDNEQFRKSLGSKPWLFYYNGDTAHLENYIKQVQINFRELSSYSFLDFEENYCFEPYFLNALKFIHA